MKTTILDAMRQATDLTRSLNLSEATRRIQTALAGGDMSAAPPTPRETPSRPSYLSQPKISAKPSSEQTYERSYQRVRRPLSETLEILKETKLHSPLSKKRGEPEVPQGAIFAKRGFQCAAGSREYKIYVPAQLADKPPLIVMLHGCTQGADDFATGTRMNELAEESGFIVVYPEQTARDNNAACWNWFRPADQSRDFGEPSIIAGITREVVAQYDVDPQKVFIAGLSAGGAMSVVIGSAYPELYAAIGVHSGLALGAATDLPSAFAAMRGSRAKRAPAGVRDQAGDFRAIIFHGAADNTVHPTNGELIFDDVHSGAAETGKISTIESQQNGRTYRKTSVEDRAGSLFLEYWDIDGLGHAWCGGDSRGSYTDARGPDASREMVRFFLKVS